jgi:hypothetical protein
MAQGSGKKWAIRVVAASLVVLAGVAGWAGSNAAQLRARFAAYQIGRAGSDEDRARAADRLLALGPVGSAKLVAFLRLGDSACRSAAAAALERRFNELPDADPHAVLLVGQVLGEFAQSDDAGRRAILGLLPIMMKRTGTTFAAQCREAIAAGLKMSDPEARLQAIRLAMHPDLRMRADLVRFVNDPLPRIRGAALFGAAMAADGEQLIGDEDLFHWLHDPDEGVRKICYDALVSRDRSEAEINLARRLVHPDPDERLKLLYDLRYEDDVADPEPWLERLSRDANPAVRLGAARVVLEVMTERKQNCPVWLNRVIEGDPDPTVRRVALFFRKELMQPSAGVRPVSGP